MAWNPVVPWVAKLRARLVLVGWLSWWSGLMVGTADLVRHGDLVWQCFAAACFIGAIAMLLSPAYLACARRRVVRSGPYGTRLEARIWTGRRTMDLAELTTVRYFMLMGRPRPSLDILVLTDKHGVHLGIDCRSPARHAARDALLEALKHRNRGAVAPNARVSRAALEELGIGRQPTWLFTLNTMLGLALIVGWPVLCFVAVGRFVIGPIGQWVT